MLRMERVVPLIPPSTVGPLGLAHLPRMWLKGVLNAADMLDTEYFPNYRGFNQRLIDAIGVDQEAFFSYLETLPTYPETERWIRDHAKTLTPAAIADWNAFVATYERPEEAAAPIRARVGLDEPTLRISSKLLNLDDWCSMHRFLVAHRGDDLEPLYPTVSSGVTGPIGIAHLPRLWMKALLSGVGALPEGWNSGFGFDKRVSDTIGMDLDAACAFIHAEMPTYLLFEDWVRTNIPPFDNAKRAGWNEMVWTREKPAEKSAEERAEVGVPELAFCKVVLLNDMVDWKHHHDRVVARRGARA
jgi:hypothetical protein